MFRKISPPGFLLLAGTGSILVTGCVVRDRGYAPPPPVAIVDSDDYVYYPGDEVYYDNTHRLYVYQDNGAWIRRAAPPRFWHREDPSVPMNFHDAPERHHPDVVRQYPRTWRPSGAAHPDARSDDGHHPGSNQGAHRDSSDNDHHDSDRDHHDH